MLKISVILLMMIVMRCTAYRRCPIQGQVYQRCRTCPATCSKPDLVCTLQCVPGCGCPFGQLIDTVNRKCVKPTQCPLNCAVVLCLRPDCSPGVKLITPPGECCPVCDDPCKTVRCRTGSRCKVYKPTGEAFCEPSCDLDNGGCSDNEQCTLKDVQCVRAPCPPIVKCTPKKCPITGQVFTTCGTACPPTCKEPGPVICTQECVVGCQCPSGTVLDEIQKRCVKLAQCTKPDKCPPTCSHKFCSNPRNRYKPCSRPPPFTVPPCPDKCRTTYCNACYYSYTAQPTPTQCSKLCKFPPSSSCLRYWARCVRNYSYFKQSSKYSYNFRCYEYPCPLRG